MLSSSKKPEVADITYTLDSYVRVPVQTYFKQPYGVLGLYLTNKCNIMCRHCCVSSGPRESTQLAIDDVLSQVPDLVAAGIAKAIHVSGGEPFLYQDALRRIAQVGYEAGIPVGINTNAFWARSVSAAHKVLESITGITQLLLSADVYHEEHLGLDCVVNAVTVGLQRGLLIHISVCTPEGKRNDFVDRLEARLGNEILKQVVISVNPVELGGRANGLPEAYWRGVEHSFPEGRCWLINRPVVLENGDVLACCNTTVAKACSQSPLILGNVKRESLLQIIDRARQDHLTQAIRLFGPKFLAENLNAEDQAKLKGEYVAGDICSLCTDLMSNPELVEAVARLMELPRIRRIIKAVQALQ